LAELRQAGYGLAAISYDPVSVLEDFARRRHITFSLLSDAGSATIKAYGLLNTTVPTANRLQYGIPFPGTLIVNRQGIVTSRTFEPAYQERDTISSALVHLGGRLNRPATRIAAPHLRLVTFATDEIVAPGTHFTLVVDATPERRAHVYAPGVTGYRPIALTVEPQPALVAGQVRYPEPVDYFFAPLNEHVAVYDRPFRIVQDVAIGASRDTEAALEEQSALVIRATLEYQACDDTVCFNPESIPLSWTVRLRRLDRERVKP
jgi:hypothetical protein